MTIEPPRIDLNLKHPRRANCPVADVQSYWYPIRAAREVHGNSLRLLRTLFTRLNLVKEYSSASKSFYLLSRVFRMPSHLLTHIYT
jgi:hypothetical protein